MVLCYSTVSDTMPLSNNGWGTHKQTAKVHTLRCNWRVHIHVMLYLIVFSPLSRARSLELSCCLVQGKELERYNNDNYKQLQS